ncbi:MAG: hypothetical protein ACR2NZ_17030, partial [Rubripirellula sp.]
YWLVLTLYWIAAPLIAARCALAGLAPQRPKGLFLLVAAMSLSGLSAAGMSVAEYRFADAPTIDSHFHLYAWLLAGYGGTCCITAFGGRIDARRFDRHQEQIT